MKFLWGVICRGTPPRFYLSICWCREMTGLFFLTVEIMTFQAALRISSSELVTTETSSGHVLEPTFGHLSELRSVALYNSVCVIVSRTYHCNIPSGVVVILFTVSCIQFLLGKWNLYKWSIRVEQYNRRHENFRLPQWNTVKCIQCCGCTGESNSQGQVVVGRTGPLMYMVKYGHYYLWPVSHCPNYTQMPNAHCSWTTNCVTLLV